MWIYFLPRVLDFNPRPRKEGDLSFIVYIILRLCISIHALVKRATSFHCLYYNVPLYFNPRPRKEGDGLGRKFSGYVRYFNPRPRKEGDGIR